MNQKNSTRPKKGTNASLQPAQNPKDSPPEPKFSHYTGKFFDPAYIKRIPMTKGDYNKYTRIDDSKTLLLRMGANPLYTGDPYVYIGHIDGKPNFAHKDDTKYIVPRRIDFDEDLQKLVDGNVIEEIKKVGWIILDGGKWGFLLDLTSLNEVYKGIVPEFWKKLLKFDFFPNQFRKFAFYYQQEMNLNFSEIPSTEIDEPVPADICPLASQLFLHQRQEVGWMFQLERSHTLSITGQLKAVPFLDSGYYLDPKDPTNLTTELSVTTMLLSSDIPGGILASQVGSGKTVSVIGLMTIGSQSEQVKEKLADQEEEKKNDVKATNKQAKGLLGTDAEDEVQKKLKWSVEGVYDPSLIVVTKNILYQWKEEFETFAPQLRVFVLEKCEQLKDLKIIEGEKYRLQDYDVVLTHRKVIEEGYDIFQELCPEIYKVCFKRVIYDEFHELITQYFNQKSQIIDDAKDPINGKSDKIVKDNSMIPHEDPNTICEVINMYKFDGCIKKFQRQFTWGITGTPDSLEFQKHTQILFGLLCLNDQYSQINIYQTFRNTFVKKFMRSNPYKVNLTKLEKVVNWVTLYQLQNLLYKGKLTYATNEKEAQLLCSHLLPQYKNLENEPDNMELAVLAIEKKHQEEIKKVQQKLETYRDEFEDLESVMREIKEEVKRKALEKFIVDKTEEYALEAANREEEEKNKEKEKKKGKAKKDNKDEKDENKDKNEVEGVAEGGDKLTEEESKEEFKVNKDDKDEKKKAKSKVQKQKKQEQQRFIMEEKYNGVIEVKETDTNLDEEQKFDKMIEKSTRMSDKAQILLNRYRALEEENNFYVEMTKLLSEDEFNCPICLEQVNNQKLVVSHCLHQTCVECYKQLIRCVNNPVCPLCKEHLVDDKLIIHPRYRTERKNKLTVILEAIKKVPEEDKIIIYTQFHSLVERLEELFTGLGIKYMVLRGEPSEINIALNKFKSVEDLKILLMSVEQSASGINVTEANHIIFAHPIFGMTFEKAALTYNQCIGRAFRIGQKKNVHVKLFVTNNSLETELVPSFNKY